MGFATTPKGCQEFDCSFGARDGRLIANYHMSTLGQVHTNAAYSMNSVEIRACARPCAACLLRASIYPLLLLSRWNQPPVRATYSLTASLVCSPNEMAPPNQFALDDAVSSPITRLPSAVTTVPSLHTMLLQIQVIQVERTCVSYMQRAICFWTSAPSRACGAVRHRPLSIYL